MLSLAHLGDDFRSSIRWHLHERTDQPQQSFVFRSFRLSAQELAELDVRQVTAGRCIRLVDDEGIAGGRLAAKEPSVTIRAAIEFSSLGHGMLPTEGIAGLTF